MASIKSGYYFPQANGIRVSVGHKRYRPIKNEPSSSNIVFAAILLILVIVVHNFFVFFGRILVPFEPKRHFLWIIIPSGFRKRDGNENVLCGLGGGRHCSAPTLSLRAVFPAEHLSTAAAAASKKKEASSKRARRGQRPFKGEKSVYV